MKIAVKVSVKAKSAKVKDEDGVLKINVDALALKGKANKRLIEILSGHFGVPKSKISISKGLHSKNKIIEIKE